MCCSSSKPTASANSTKDNLLRAAVQPLEKNELDPIILLYNTVNPNLIFILGRNYQPSTLLFVGLEARLNLSTGKYEGVAAFSERPSGVHADGPTETPHWIPLLQALFSED